MRDHWMQTFEGSGDSNIYEVSGDTEMYEGSGDAEMYEGFGGCRYVLWIRRFMRGQGVLTIVV